MSQKIVVTVVVQRHGHDARVRSAEVTSGPPHVRRFIVGSLCEVATELSAYGYTYQVKTRFEDVSLIEWVGGATDVRTHY
jgi:hypothetical protein